MKKLILILSIILPNLIFSQTDECSIDEIQLDTYKYALNNLNRINKSFSNKNALIEVSIEFKEYTLEAEEKKNYAEIKSIEYFLISPENSYSGENKEKIKVYPKLDSYINEKINSCIKNSSEFKSHLYNNITFRIPLNEKNIKIAIEQVKSIIRTE
jgi:hypothetical protein